jgi:hypothetical protein
MGHTGCHQLNRVLTHNNTVREKCQPLLQNDVVKSAPTLPCFDARQQRE